VLNLENVLNSEQNDLNLAFAQHYHKIGNTGSNGYKKLASQSSKSGISSSNIIKLASIGKNKIGWAKPGDQRRCVGLFGAEEEKMAGAEEEKMAGAE
jgi:hypothetical protein